MTSNQIQKDTSGGWQIKKLGEVASLLKDGSHGTHADVINGVPLLSAKDLKMGGVDVNNNPRLISIEDFNQIHKNYRIKNGDILVSLVGSIGKVALVKNYNDNYTLQRSVGILRFENDNNLFLYHFFNTKYFQNQLLVKENKGAQGGVYLGSLSKIKLSLPPVQEQNRIVSVLETWDKAIELLARKIEVKKRIKKGLMQRLLTGKLRVPGFSDAWQTVKLGDIGTTYSGITGKDKDSFGFGKPYISYMNIYSNSRISTNITDLVDIKDSENQNMAKYGDVFFTTSSETPHEVGISSVLLDKNAGVLYLNSFCFGFRFNDFKIMVPEYAEFFFRGNDFRKQMTRIAQGASRFNLSKRYFLVTKIKIPSDVKEQIAIAKVLVDADKELLMLNSKLKLLTAQKKYLLNNLITGTIRTPENLTINV